MLSTARASVSSISMTVTGHNVDSIGMEIPTTVSSLVPEMTKSNMAKTIRYAWQSGACFVTEWNSVRKQAV